MPNYIQKSINESLDIITQKKSCELVRIYHEIKKDLHLSNAAQVISIISNHQVVRFMDREYVDAYLRVIKFCSLTLVFTVLFKNKI